MLAKLFVIFCLEKNKYQHKIYFPQTILYSQKQSERKVQKKKEMNQNVKPSTVQPTSKDTN
jgi:hypothetical protein